MIYQEGVVLMCRQQSRLKEYFKLVTHTANGYQTFDAYFVCIKSLFFNKIYGRKQIWKQWKLQK